MRRVKPRPYDLAGQTLVKKTASRIVLRATDPAVPDHELTDVERYVRDQRQDFPAPLGGTPPSAVLLEFLDELQAALIVAKQIRTYVLDLAEASGVISGRTGKVRPVVEQHRLFGTHVGKQLVLWQQLVQSFLAEHRAASPKSWEQLVDEHRASSAAYEDASAPTPPRRSPVPPGAPSS